MAERCVFKLGRYRLGFQRYRDARWAVRSGGQATPWPWREVSLPWIGSLVLGRTRPRPMPHEPRADRLHLCRADPTQDVGPCDCPIGVDHDGPAALRGGTQCQD